MFINFYLLYFFFKFYYCNNTNIHVVVVNICLTAALKTKNKNNNFSLIIIRDHKDFTLIMLLPIFMVGGVVLLVAFIQWCCWLCHQLKLNVCFLLPSQLFLFFCYYVYYYDFVFKVFYAAKAFSFFVIPWRPLNFFLYLFARFEFFA